jgi:cell shape-determining protein MreC
MIHQFRDKKQIERKKVIIRNTIGLGLFFVLSIFGVLTWSGKLFNYIGRPIWNAEKMMTDGLYNINYLVRSKSSISLENHNLIEEISALRLSMSDYQILKKENEDLKELLGRLPTNKDFVLGNILTKPNHSPYDTIVIDIGINDNVSEGSLVYANGNIPIGNIGRVYEKTSLVTLYSNPGQKTEGFMDITNASVLLTGRGGGNFEMIIPVDLTAEKGTVIFLPGNNSEVLALVDEIISRPSDPFKKVILSSPVNVQNLKWIQVKKD